MQFVSTAVASPAAAAVGASAAVGGSKGATDADEQRWLAEDVELRGRKLRRWRGAAVKGAIQPYVLMYEGDFQLDVGLRRMRADRAVIWFTPRRLQAGMRYQFVIYLEGNARITEPAGTVLKDKTLLVSLRTKGRVTLSYDLLQEVVAEDSPLYKRAVEARKQRPPVLQPVVPEVPGGVVGPRGPVVRAEVRIYPRGRCVIENEVRGGLDITTYQGPVYITQGKVGEPMFIELRADNVVVFWRRVQLRRAVGQSGRKGLQRWQRVVSGVYLEGDVVLQQGLRMIRAEAMFYDFDYQRAVILDAVMHMIHRQRNIPIYIRADKIRQLSRNEFAAYNAKLTTSEFYTPHYHVGARYLYLRDRTLRDEQYRPLGPQRYRYRMKAVTVNVDNVPILLWPWAAGDFRSSETAIRSVRTSYSSTMGLVGETKWHLDKLLGLAGPEGFESLLRLDYFGRRGPGVGVDVDYQRDDYYGFARGYFLHDQGEDDLGRDRKDIEPDENTRGRILWRHRHFLPKNWQMTLELSYISDPTYLEQYEPTEFDTGKEQETLIRLQKQQDNWAFWLQGQVRLNDFLTQTERLPEAGFSFYGPLPLVPVVYYTDSRAGLLRHDIDDRIDQYGNLESDSVWRIDTRHELSLPVTLGPVQLNCYGSVRLAAYDDGPTGEANHYRRRLFGTAGLRASTYFWRLWPQLESRFWDLHGMRHIINPQVDLFLAGTSTDRNHLYPFDEQVELIDDTSGVSFSLRQLWQTKRGPAEARHIVDWLTLDLRATFFSNPADSERHNGYFVRSFPEQSITRNQLSGEFSFRISDTTIMLGSLNYDPTDAVVDRADIGISVQRWPRLNWYFGSSYVRPLDTQVLTYAGTYRLNRKYTLSFAQQYDTDVAAPLATDVSLIRKFPRWYVALTVDVDTAGDSTTFTLSIWPEGIPEVAIGSRRFVGLTRSEGLSP